MIHVIITCSLCFHTLCISFVFKNLQLAIDQFAILARRCDLGERHDRDKLVRDSNSNNILKTRKQTTQFEIVSCDPFPVLSWLHSRDSIPKMASQPWLWAKESNLRLPNVVFPKRMKPTSASEKNGCCNLLRPAGSCSRLLSAANAMRSRSLLTSRRSIWHLGGRAKPSATRKTQTDNNPG